ncbi:ATPase family associated with various cellular activities (AAA) [Novosphingobium sp. CF614]|uniref:AAA family ATPase n=1 Tax=Novosphingobium sp. CF614 TaxID=1884364 RepID=UPI0008EB6B04|nr:ATP-binding protein [Novosphingobium sp. CF614]SFF76383.1 ATPase family associated with various cellular activities (AAA) [Novosphingobium sp. CF614]
MTADTQPLAREMAVIEARLALAAALSGSEDDIAQADALLEAALAGLGAGGPARRLAERLGLGAFERDCLLLAAGPHLNPRVAPLCARFSGDPQGRVTAAVAMAALPGAQWSALRPDAPLRALRCLRLADPDRPTLSELLIDERMLLALLGEDAMDERLAPLVQPVGASGTLPDTGRQAVTRLVERWWAVRAGEQAPVLQIRHGEGEGADARMIAAAIAERLGRRLHALSPANLPPTSAERHGFAALWRREQLLGGLALLIELPDDPSPDQLAMTADMADRLDDLVVVTGQGALPCRRALVGETLARPDVQERHALWAQGLGREATARLNGATEALARQFELGATAIGRLSALARGMEPDIAKDLLNREARAHAQSRIAAIADVIHPAASWDDLVLPPDLKAVLKGIAAQVRHRAQVHDDWGFAARGSRGLGIAALFAGPSGTGKTMAAEVIAGDLRTDLVRVDLAGVVSKYIGETEKNLSRVFAAAEGSGAVLLFDEADALFGKRSEVSSAHDRYANIEVSYLLQRMESYTGLAILTTNQRESLDGAFFRRLRFVLGFPFPDAPLRRAVWERAFPAQTETQGLDLEQLSRLNVAPGNIRGIAINAAFLAAAQAQPVTMRHVHEAAVLECRKLERPVTAAELGGWL